jgi:hypothetical protein
MHVLVVEQLRLHIRQVYSGWLLRDIHPVFFQWLSDTHSSRLALGIDLQAAKFDSHPRNIHPCVKLMRKRVMALCPLKLLTRYWFMRLAIAHFRARHLRYALSTSRNTQLVRAGRSGLDSRQGRDFILCHHIPPTQHPIRWSPEAASPGVKLLEHEDDHLPPSNADFKNAWS